MPSDPATRVLQVAAAARRRQTPPYHAWPDTVALDLAEQGFRDMLGHDAAAATKSLQAREVGFTVEADTDETAPPPSCWQPPTSRAGRRAPPGGPGCTWSSATPSGQPRTPQAGRRRWTPWQLRACGITSPVIIPADHTWYGDLQYQVSTKQWRVTHGYLSSPVGGASGIRLPVSDAIAFATARWGPGRQAG
ncbi:MAG TPA: hypothetical protein VHN80_23815 [Kineosporiaceae bacterium]|nr:hypothetical protein [Kineosporiaceae bacterium]